MRNIDLAFWLSTPKTIVKNVVLRNFDIIRLVLWLIVTVLMFSFAFYVIFIGDIIKTETTIGMVTAGLFIGYVITDCLGTLGKILHHVNEYNDKLRTNFPRPLSED